jgi:hypothetical protein
LQNKRAEQVFPGSRGGEEVAQIMYTHVSKCKNNKIKLKEKDTEIGVLYQYISIRNFFILRNLEDPNGN